MKRIETNVENIIAVKDATTLIQLRKESLKNSSLPGFDPWPLWYQFSALTNWANKLKESWSLNWFVIYPGKMKRNIWIHSGCSSCFCSESTITWNCHSEYFNSSYAMALNRIVTLYSSTTRLWETWNVVLALGSVDKTYGLTIQIKPLEPFFCMVLSSLACECRRIFGGEGRRPPGNTSAIAGYILCWQDGTFFSFAFFSLA